MNINYIHMNISMKYEQCALEGRLNNLLLHIQTISCAFKMQEMCLY